MNFAPGSARFHIAQNALKIDDVGCDRLHFSERLVDIFESFADESERFRDAFFQRGLQFFVHDTAHFVQLFCVFFPQDSNGIFHRASNGFEGLSLFRSGMRERFADEGKLAREGSRERLGLKSGGFGELFPVFPQSDAGRGAFCGKGFCDAFQRILGVALKAFPFIVLKILLEN